MTKFNPRIRFWKMMTMLRVEFEWFARDAAQLEEMDQRFFAQVHQITFTSYFGRRGRLISHSATSKK
ncbi:MAG: hypothetical protein ACREIW_06620 [Chthoniobacterales bacterium]